MVGYDNIVSYAYFPIGVVLLVGLFLIAFFLDTRKKVLGILGTAVTVYALVCLVVALCAKVVFPPFNYIAEASYVRGDPGRWVKEFRDHFSELYHPEVGVVFVQPRAVFGLCRELGKTPPAIWVSEGELSVEYTGAELLISLPPSGKSIRERNEAGIAATKAVITALGNEQLAAEWEEEYRRVDSVAGLRMSCIVYDSSPRTDVLHETTIISHPPGEAPARGYSRIGPWSAMGSLFFVR